MNEPFGYRLKECAILLSLLLVLSLPSFDRVQSWSNGGFSSNPSNPNYGTHDWVAQHALDWLPNDKKDYILDNLATYLYGTELPDNGQAVDGIGDTGKHHIYFYQNGALQDDSAATRAEEEYLKSLTYLIQGDLKNAAKHAGIMTHYISDMAVFGHVMGSQTCWGNEVHHSDYEDYVQKRTTDYISEFNQYLTYDGRLDNVSAYNAAVSLAYDTTFDPKGNLTAVWMDRNYDWNNPIFRERAIESINLAVNYVADTLYTLNAQAQSSSPTVAHVVINEIEQNPTGTDAGQEWVELYNPTSDYIDISGWRISTTAGETVTISIPSGARVPAGGYYVVTYGSQWLDNEGESTILQDSKGNEVDRTPTFSDTYNDDRSWQRYPNGFDTDADSDWRFRSSTRGLSNGGETAGTTTTATTTTVIPTSATTTTATTTTATTKTTIQTSTITATTVNTTTSPTTTSSPATSTTPSPNLGSDILTQTSLGLLLIVIMTVALTLLLRRGKTKRFQNH